MRVAVVIPAYRACETIERVLSGIPEWVDAIYVVDDASPDDTAAKARAHHDPRVHVLVHGVNRGVGGAMVTGYRHALQQNADICVKMDADDQMDPIYLPDLLDPLVSGRADYTKGNRFHNIHHLGQMPIIRRIGNAGLSFLIKAASGQWRIFDPTNGYTAIHGTALTSVLALGNLHQRFFFESSMLIALRRVGAMLEDVPIPARYGDERSNLSIFRALMEFPWLLLRGGAARIFWQYFVIDFGPVSLFLLCGVPLAVFGGIFGLYHWIDSYRRGVLTPTGTVMLAVLPLILGFQLLLQALVQDVQNVPARPLHSRLRSFRRPVASPNMGDGDVRGGAPAQPLRDGLTGSGAHRTGGRIRWFVVAAILALAISSNMTASARMAYRELAFISAHQYLPREERLRLKFWDRGVDFGAFVRNHSPETSVILIPPPKAPWIFTGNRFVFSYFVYPRRLVNAPFETSPAAVRDFLRAHPEITHVVITSEGAPWPGVTFGPPDDVVFDEAGWGLAALRR